MFLCIFIKEIKNWLDKPDGLIVICICETSVTNLSEITLKMFDDGNDGDNKDDDGDDDLTLKK